MAHIIQSSHYRSSTHSVKTFCGTPLPSFEYMAQWIALFLAQVKILKLIMTFSQFQSCFSLKWSLKPMTLHSLFCSSAVSNCYSPKTSLKNGLIPLLLYILECQVLSMCIWPASPCSLRILIIAKNLSYHSSWVQITGSWYQSNKSVGNSCNCSLTSKLSYAIWCLPSCPIMRNLLLLDFIYQKHLHILLQVHG